MPLQPADIDRVLSDSADAGHHTDPSAPLRAWRDDLARARASLCYAETVLTADVAILRHCLAGGTGGPDVVEALAPVVAAPSEDAGARSWPASRALADVDLEAALRADLLVSTHREMARVDLSSHHDVARVLGLVEQQLDETRARRQAVEDRLGELRAAILRRYQHGVLPTLERPA